MEIGKYSLKKLNPRFQKKSKPIQYYGFDNTSG